MSQTATLSDFTRTHFDADGARCTFEIAPKSLSSLAAIPSSLWELAVTALMLVLAPVILLALAGAFVVACLRIHISEMGTESEIFPNQPLSAVEEASRPTPVNFNRRAH